MTIRTVSADILQFFFSSLKCQYVIGKSVVFTFDVVYVCAQGVTERHEYLTKKKKIDYC